MKKVIYISAVVVGLSFVSCQKQDLTPASESSEVPTWDSSSDSAREANTNAKGNPEDEDNTGVIITGGTGGATTIDDGEITDPNADPDAG